MGRPHQNRARIPAPERKAIFHEQYGNDLDAGTSLAEIVTAAGDLISRMVGAPGSDAGMARIVRGVVEAAGNKLDGPGEWRDALNASRGYCFSQWQIGTALHAMTAYAIYGIVLSESEDQEELAHEIQRLLHEVEVFLSAVPIGQWQLPENSDLIRLVRLARNRWALDNGQSVEPAALAEFGGVSEGRIRNMMSGTSRIFTSQGGRVPAHEALAWLSQRDAFWTSVWREQRLPQYGVKRRKPVPAPVFVPVGPGRHPFPSRPAAR